MRGGRNGPSSTGGVPLNDLCAKAESDTTSKAWGRSSGGRVADPDEWSVVTCCVDSLEAS